MRPAVDVSKIDASLKRYGASEARIAANLVEFDNHPTYQLLTNGASTGLTAEQLCPVMADAPLLWRWLTQLTGVLDQARTLRGTGRINGDRREQIVRLLDTPAVVLEVEEIPFAERDLTGRATSERRVTVEQLIALMRMTYEPIRDGVAAVDRIWRLVTPSLEAARDTIDSLDAELAPLPVSEPAELTACKAQLARTEQLLVEDPLGLGAKGGTHLDSAVSVAATRVHSLVTDHSSLDGDVAATETILAELRVLRAVAAAAWSEARANFVDVGALIRPPGTPVIDGDRGLASRAANFNAHGVDWRAMRTDIDSWFALAERLRSQLKRAVHINSAPLDSRDELRGRLAAYRAKASALGRSSERALDDLAADAHEELYTRPIDLDRAARLVQDYAAALRTSDQAGTEETT
jgi:hypothetical protein